MKITMTEPLEKMVGTLSYWKARLNVPHLLNSKIDKRMIQGNYRLIYARNNSGDVVKIKVENKKAKDGWKLEVTTTAI
jgi:hypothetical protein